MRAAGNSLTVHFLAILLVLVVTLGCSGPRTANKANSGAAIDTYFGQFGEACLGVRLSSPHEVEDDAGALSGLSSSDSRLLGELVLIGVASSEAVELKRECTPCTPGIFRERQ